MLLLRQHKKRLLALLKVSRVLDGINSRIALMLRSFYDIMKSFKLFLIKKKGDDFRMFKRGSLFIVAITFLLVLSPKAGSCDYLISGKVFQSDGKTPVEGAKVMAFRVNKDGLPDKFATSSKDGTYTMDNLEPATYNLLCLSDEAVFPIKRNVTINREKSYDINFIAYNNYISGVVKDEQGNPIKDAKVSIQYIPTKEDIRDYNFFSIRTMGKLDRKTKTNNNGEYTIKSLIPGSYYMEVYSSKYGREVKDKITIEPNTQLSKFNFVLRKTQITIFGKVTEKDGITPVANAYITFIDSRGKLVGDILKSDSNGTFRIENLNEDIYLLFIKKKGLATIIRKVKLKEEKRIDLKLKMEQPGSISGTIYYKDKKTPAGYIKVHAVKKEQDSGGSAVTDEKGFYKIEDLKEGIYKVKAFSIDRKKGIVECVKENVKVEANKETPDIVICLDE